MLSSQGNPQARNLFEIVAYLQKVDGMVFGSECYSGLAKSHISKSRCGALDYQQNPLLERDIVSTQFVTRWKRGALAPRVEFRIEGPSGPVFLMHPRPSAQELRTFSSHL
jgi:hypothetical protein